MPLEVPTKPRSPQSAATLGTLDQMETLVAPLAELVVANTTVYGFGGNPPPNEGITFDQKLPDPDLLAKSLFSGPFRATLAEILEPIILGRLLDFVNGDGPILAAAKRTPPD